MPSISSLECSRCHHNVSADTPQTVCPLCGGTLYVRYNMEQLKHAAKREEIAPRAAANATNPGMWRYASVLPDVTPVTLGEGWTPMLRSARHPNLYIKEEVANPTGTIEARGIGLAATMAKHYGIQRLVLASNDAAAGTIASYATAAGIRAQIFMPQDMPLASRLEGDFYGIDVSPFKEPFRLEGEKTIGYELVEQLGWEYPDVVFCPLGTAIMAIWKAFEEMEQLGWIKGKRPRMYAIQYASKPCEDSVLHHIVRESGGRVVESGDEAICTAALDWGREEGILFSQDGAVAAVAYDSMVAAGELKATDRVVLINSGAGLKCVRRAVKLPTSLPVGGIITPQ